MQERVQNEPDDSRDLEVWAGAEGVEIVSLITGQVLVTVRHSQLTDLIKQLVDATGESLVFRVRDAQAGNGEAR